MTIATNPDTDKRISTLNTYLRGEISATETYALAITQLGTAAPDVLRDNRECHARRVSLLRDKITAAGGQPDATSGVWGSMAKLVEKGAAVVGQQMVYNVLEEGEDRGLAMYRDLKHVDPATMEMISTHLLPHQVRTHERMRALKKSG